MSEKRKDHKGRILRTGESRRKDLIYQYRYTDIRGKRQTVYSSDLRELREKEKEIQKQLDAGIDYAAGKITAIELVERYIGLKQGIRYNTKVGYNFVRNLIRQEDFGYRPIRDIKCIRCPTVDHEAARRRKGRQHHHQRAGRCQTGISNGLQRDIIRKNPFDFKLVEVVPRLAEANHHDPGAAGNLDGFYSG